MDDTSVPDPIANLINTYNDLNNSVIEELDGEPSPLEFMRYVARNTPFVVRGAAADWKASQKWNVEHLREALGHLTVNVAITPAGYVEKPAQPVASRLVDLTPTQKRGRSHHPRGRQYGLCQALRRRPTLPFLSRLCRPARDLLELYPWLRSEICPNP